MTVLELPEYPQWTMFEGNEDNDKDLFPFGNNRDFCWDYTHKPCGDTVIEQSESNEIFECSVCRAEVPNALRVKVRNYLAFKNAAARLR